MELLRNLKWQEVPGALLAAVTYLNASVDAACDCPLTDSAAM